MSALAPCVAYCMEPAAKRSTYNPVAAAMSVVQQAGVEHPQAQHSPTQQQVIPLALKAMMQHTQRSLLHKQDPHGGGRPPDTPGHPVALQTVQGNVSANFVASPVPLVQTVCCHQPVLGVLPLVDKESPVNKTETVAVKCAANMSPGLMMPWLHAAHVNMTHVADPGPVPLAQAAMAKAMQDAYTVSPMEPVVGTPTNVIQPAPAIAPTTPPDTPKADLDAAAKHLLGMFPQNMDLDLTTCQDVLATFQGDMETAAEHLMSMFSCSKHTSSRWDEPTAIPATPSPPVVSLLHSILPDAHLHYSSFEQNNQMDADAALAAKLQKEEEDAAQHHLANSDTSSNDEMPEQLALLLSPTEMYYAMNPTTNSNTATTECDVQAMHLPNPQQDSPHLSAFLLPDEALAASLVAEDQLFSAQSHDQRVKALCRELAPVLRSFFPDITLEEAQHVLEAFEGNMEEAQEALWRSSEDDTNHRAAQMHADAEYARALHEQEGASSASVSVSVEEEMMGVAAAGLEGRGRRTGKDPTLSPAHLLLRSRTNLDAIDRQHAAFAQLPHTRGGFSSPGAGSTTSSSGDNNHSEQWDEVQSEAVGRRLGKLAKLFGPGVDRSLLTDVLNSCGGDVEAACQQLVSMGISQVAPCTTPCALSPRAYPASASCTQLPATMSPQPLKRNNPRAGSSSWLASSMVAPHGQQSGEGDNGSLVWVADSVPAAKPRLHSGLTSSMLRDMEQAAAQKRAMREAEDALEDGGGAVSDDTDSGDEAGEAAALDAWYAEQYQAMRAQGHVLDKEEVHRRTQLVRNCLMAKSQQLRRRSRRLSCAIDRARAAGDTALARDLVARSRMCFERVRRLEERNANRMFEFRNSHTAQQLSIDLHGLCLREALGKIDTHVDLFERLPGWKHVTIITGRGLHSQGAPVLLPAVREWLKNRGCEYEECPGYFQFTMAPECKA